MEVRSCSFLSLSPTVGYPSGRLQSTHRPQRHFVKILPKPQMCEVSHIPAGHPGFLAVLWRAELNIQHPGVQRGCVLSTGSRSSVLSPFLAMTQHAESGNQAALPKSYSEIAQTCHVLIHRFPLEASPTYFSAIWFSCY